MSHELKKIHAAVERVISAGERALLVTVIATHGSTYRRAGARTVIAKNLVCGAISGGCIEKDLALRTFEGFDARLITYDSSSSDDIVFGLGLGCRGVLELLVQPFDREHPPALPPIPDREPIVWITSHEGRDILAEVIEPQRTIAIFGSGDDVEPVVALARSIGWHTEVIRTREVPLLDRYDAVVVMTHNFMRDVEILGAALTSKVAYVGLLGPKSRGEEILTQLAGVTPEMRIRLHNPIGLDLGGDSPEDIALSIVAEIQAVLNRRRAESLREKDGPIHDSCEQSQPSSQPVSRRV
jgi:xanthine/CO dehydrogenase XdhC/CoxF family maturation factor